MAVGSKNGIAGFGGCRIGNGLDGVDELPQSGAERIVQTSVDIAGVGEVGEDASLAVRSPVCLRRLPEDDRLHRCRSNRAVRQSERDGLSDRPASGDHRSVVVDDEIRVRRHERRRDRERSLDSEAARHSDPRTTTVHDRRRQNFDRHAAYAVVAFVTSG
jgi:hypothetical protein